MSTLVVSRIRIIGSLKLSYTKIYLTIVIKLSNAMLLNDSDVNNDPFAIIHSISSCNSHDMWYLYDNRKKYLLSVISCLYIFKSNKNISINVKIYYFDFIC